MTWENVTTGLTNLAGIVTNAFSVIGGNPPLMALFSGTFLFLAFRIVRAAKRAAR